jgi:hypothetical protein
MIESALATDAVKVMVCPSETVTSEELLISPTIGKPFVVV